MKNKIQHFIIQINKFKKLCKKKVMQQITIIRVMVWNIFIIPPKFLVSLCSESLPLIPLLRCQAITDLFSISVLFPCFESYLNEFIYSMLYLTSTFSMMLLRLLCVDPQFILFILSRILLCAYTTVSYPFSSWIHGCFSSLELLWIKLVLTFTYKSLCQYVFISYVNTQEWAYVVFW